MRRRVGLFSCGLAVFLAWGSPGALGDGVDRSCRNAPEDAVVVLPEPFDQWGRVRCLPGYGHWLGAPKDSLWLSGARKQGRRQFSSLNVSALGRRAYKGKDRHKGYFVRMKALPDNVSDFVYGMWPEAAPKTGDGKPYRTVRQLLAASNFRQFYSLFFFLGDGGPEWLLVCHDTKAEQFCKAATLAKVTAFPPDLKGMPMPVMLAR